MGFIIKIYNSRGDMISRFNTGFEYCFDDLPELIVCECSEYDFQINGVANEYTAVIIDRWDYENYEMGVSKINGNFVIAYCDLIDWV